VDGHRNFAIDFKAPEDLVTINDLRVSLRSAQPIRSAILYVRGRLLVGSVPAPVAPARAQPPRDDRPPRIAPEPPPQGGLRRRVRLQEDAGDAGDAEAPPDPTPPRRRLS
jgi:hypothetical protein